MGSGGCPTALFFPCLVTSWVLFLYSGCDLGVSQSESTPMRGLGCLGCTGWLSYNDFIPSFCLIDELPFQCPTPTLYFALDYGSICQRLHRAASNGRLELLE